MKTPTETTLFAAVHGLILCEGKALCTKRANTTRYRPGLWDIPGGTVEVGESPLQALEREFSEEIKIQVSILKPIFVYNNLTQFPNRQTLQIVYLCCSDQKKVTLNAREHQEYVWLENRDILDLEKIEFFEALSNQAQFDKYFEK